MRSVNRGCSLLLALSIGIGIGGCGGSDDGGDSGLPEGAAAKVGDTVIKESTVRERLSAIYDDVHSSLARFGPPDYPDCVRINRAAGKGQSTATLREQCKTTFESTRAGVVDTLIHVPLLAREVKRRTLNVDAAADRALDTLLRFRDPGTAQIDPHWAAVNSRMTTQREKLLAVTPVTPGEITAYGKAHPKVPRASASYAIRSIKLERALHAHYAAEVTCARRYQVSAAPQCL